jgi:hypothetical protein
MSVGPMILISWRPLARRRAFSASIQSRMTGIASAVSLWMSWMRTTARCPSASCSMWWMMNDCVFTASWVFHSSASMSQWTWRRWRSFSASSSTGQRTP